MLEVKDVKRIFQSGDIKVAAVNGVSFSIPEGEFASIVGRSGSGKSTLLSMLGALDKPTSGSIMIDGKDIATLSDHALISYRCEENWLCFSKL